MSRDLTLTVNIVSTLQSIAQKMVAGEWVHLDGATRTVGTTPNVVCTKPANIDYALSEWPDYSGQTFVWGSRVRWNPVVKSIEYFGGNTHAAPRLYGRYTEADHRFESWICPSPQHSNPDYRWGSDYNIGTHTFDRVTVNPFTGKVWVSDYNYGTLALFEFDSGPPKDSWDDYKTIGNPRTTTPYAVNLFGPTDWWTEPSSLTGAGAQGLLIVTTDSHAGVMRFMGYNPLTNTWPLIVTAPNSTGHNYNRIGNYSKVKNCFVSGCSNNFPSDLFRLSANGTVTKYATMPFDGRLGQAQWADDPTTGNFLVIHGVGPNQGDGHFWQFNPDTDVWTQLPSLPAGMHWHIYPNDSNNTMNTVVAAPLYGPEYNGVIAYICSGNDYGRMWLYKHA